MGFEVFRVIKALGFFDAGAAVSCWSCRARMHVYDYQVMFFLSFLINMCGDPSGRPEPLRRHLRPVVVRHPSAAVYFSYLPPPKSITK